MDLTVSSGSRQIRLQSNRYSERCINIDIYRYNAHIANVISKLVRRTVEAFL